MKKLHYVLPFLFICGVSHGGLITHSDYSAGNVITAAGQNTNENAIVNEFNGNISAANLASDSVTSAKILDGTIVNADLNSSLQSTFTFVNYVGSYRRPTLTFIGTTSVDIAANTGTANQTCVMFPDVVRCVTENTSSSSVNRRLLTNETASNSGTKNSGMAIGETAVANTWYSVYAWKVSDNSTDFVMAATTNTPVQARFAILNTLFGTNGWVYLGLIRNGDNVSATTSLCAFLQTGNRTIFDNPVAGQARNGLGIRLASAVGVSSHTYTYTSGMTNLAIPPNVFVGTFQGGTNSGAVTITWEDAGGTRKYFATEAAGVGTVRSADVDATAGYAIATSGSVTIDIFLSGFVDDTLGLGSNPQL